MVLEFFNIVQINWKYQTYVFLMRASNSIVGFIAVPSFADEHGIATTLVVSIRGLAPEFLKVQCVLSIAA